MTFEAQRQAPDAYPWDPHPLVKDLVSGLPYDKDNLTIVIGRGWTGCLTEIPCDINGAAFQGLPTPSTPHLWLDFCHLETLERFPSNSIQHIVFDLSTWRYMSLSPLVIQQWHRILRKGGRLAFEFGVCSVSPQPIGLSVEPFTMN